MVELYMLYVGITGTASQCKPSEAKRKLYNPSQLRLTISLQHIV